MLKVLSNRTENFFSWNNSSSIRDNESLVSKWNEILKPVITCDLDESRRVNDTVFATVSDFFPEIDERAWH